MRLKTFIVCCLLFILFMQFPLVHASPSYEDFTTYEEEDPNNHLAQTSSRSTFTNLGRNEDAYLYKDKEAGHFDGDFDHKFDFKIVGGVQYSYVIPWCLMNTVDDYSGRGNDHVSVYIHHSSGLTLDCVIRARYAGGTEQVDSSAGFGSEATTYYARVKRSGSISTLKLYASASNRDSETSPIVTLSVNPAGVSSLRYIYATQSVNIGGDYAISGYVENLDLQEPIDIWYVTFYFNEGGQFRVDNATITNGTENNYENGTVIELASLPQTMSWVFLSFNWTDESSMTNPHDITIDANDTIWCYFGEAGAISEDEDVINLWFGLLFGFFFLLCGLIVGSIRRGRRQTSISYYP